VRDFLLLLLLLLLIVLVFVSSTSILFLYILFQFIPTAGLRSAVLLISASAFLPGATIKRASGGGEDDKNKGKQLQGLSHLFLSSLSPQ